VSRAALGGGAQNSDLAPAQTRHAACFKAASMKTDSSREGSALAVAESPRAPRPGFARLGRDRRGATFVEYMILVGMALALVGAFTDFGSAVKTRLGLTPAASFRPMSLMGL
jgi:Flp pilus assembly pilin Flp